MNNKFKPFEFEDEVVYIEPLDKVFNEYPMFKVSQLISQIKYIVQKFGNYEESKINKWFEEDIYGEALKLGAKGWQKGKVRIRVSLEFCPDEPEIEEILETQKISQQESSLDDIRRMIS